MKQLYPLCRGWCRWVASSWPLLLLALALRTSPAAAQTPYPLVSGNYFEGFDNVGSWADGFASGVGAAPYGAVGSTYSGTPPTGLVPSPTVTTISSSTFVAGGTGGVQRYVDTTTPAANGLALLAPGTTDNKSAVAVDLFLDFTTRQAGQLSFKWTVLANGASTSDRTASLRVYASTDGATFTELPAAAVLNKVNNSSDTGIISGVQLPASFNNSATARLRFYCYNGTGGSTGSRPKLLLDNVGVTSVPLPAIYSLSPASVAVGSGGQAITITGSNFTSTSVAYFNGSARTTALGSGTQLVVTLLASDVAVQGVYPMWVVDGAKISNTLNLLVAQAYYTKASGSLNTLSTFGTNTDGSGTPPPNFTATGQVFYVGGSLRTITANWTVSGAGSKMVLLANSVLVIPSNYNLFGTLDAGAGAMLEVNTTSAVSGVAFGTLDATSTITFSQNASYVVPAVPAPGYGNLILRNGTKTLPASPILVQGNLQLDNLTAFGGTALNLGGNLLLTSPVTFDATAKIALTTTNAATQQTLSGNGTALELLSLSTSSNTPGVALGPATNLLLGSSAGGGYTLGANSTLSVGDNTLTFLAGGQAAIGAGTGVLRLTPASVLVFNKSGAAPLGTLRADVTANTLASLTINATGGASISTNDLTLGSALKVNGPFSMPSGQLSLSANTLMLNGPVALGAPGTAQLNGSTTASLVFGGAGSISTLSFAATGSVLGDLTMSHTDTVTVKMASTLTVYSSLGLNQGSLRFLGSNRLIIAGSAVLLGGGTNSFVNALMQSAVTNSSSKTAALPYPVGSRGQYRPLVLTITASTGTTSYTVRILDGAPPAHNLPGTIQRVSQVRYFTILPETSTSIVTNASVGLSYGADDGVGTGNTNPTTLRVARSDPAASGQWQDLGGSYAYPFVTTTVPFSNFSSDGLFVLADNGNNPLPVTLLSFGAQRQASGVLVNWRTASEQHNAYFEVERSLDGVVFSAVGKVTGAGTSAQAHNYHYLDAQVPGELVYYRLRQADDYSGLSSYSTVAVVPGGPAATQLALYPNPATDQLIVSLPAQAAGQPLQVFDLRGSAVALPELATGVLDVRQLAAGSYFVRVGAGGAGLTRRFVKL
ncbi:T9SS type A sorting domain-containing protein [Hymenobacter sp. BRD67]|uniref:T9SS type A sorting domain-containing protein n=1 Tax=Hymenobacter sp. BRD67 TaxID=2675877 RepID=UPI0015667D38|nr:T9SS type A sorting domain-containing protein [Hymenobacter sp. BRD67]QKG53953.1 T9SS type A sorting domain-containing protein [Hymenobacter sp. BRD67]